MPRWLGALAFFGTVVIVWGGLHFYLYTRLASGFDLGARARLILKIAMVVLALLYLVGRLLEGTIGERASWALMWPGAVWMGLFSLVVTALLILDLWVRLPCFILYRSGVLSLATQQAMTRWGVDAAALSALLLSAWGMYRALAGPSVTPLALELAGMPASADGFSIGVVSDIHVGDMVTHAYLDRLVRQLNDQQLDLVVLLGDLSDERNGGDGRAYDALAHIRSRYGVVAVTGNHEFYSGGDRVVQALQAHGIALLRNSNRVIANAFVLAGVDDPTFLPHGRSSAAMAIDWAMSGRRDGLPVVLLAHQPLAAEHAADMGVKLMLCGHTHGGQLPPFQFVSGLAYPFLRGQHRVGDMLLYVNNGAGFWGPPIRVFADPEIVRVTLKAKP
jgi:uncharacterized protein